MAVVLRLSLIFGTVSLAALLVACGNNDIAPDSGSEVSPSSVAPGPSEIAPDPESDGRSLGTVTLTGRDLNLDNEIDVTLFAPETHDVEPGESGSKPHYGVYLVFIVKVEVKEGAYFAHTTSFSFVTAGGARIMPAFVPGFGPQLHKTVGKTDPHTSGTLIFDLKPEQIDGGRVEITGIGDAARTVVGQWKL